MQLTWSVAVWARCALSAYAGCTLLLLETLSQAHRQRELTGTYLLQAACKLLLFTLFPPWQGAQY